MEKCGRAMCGSVTCTRMPNPRVHGMEDEDRFTKACQVYVARKASTVVAAGRTADRICRLLYRSRCEDRALTRRRRHREAEARELFSTDNNGQTGDRSPSQRRGGTCPTRAGARIEVQRERSSAPFRGAYPRCVRIDRRALGDRSLGRSRSSKSVIRRLWNVCGLGDVCCEGDRDVGEFAR